MTEGLKPVEPGPAAGRNELPEVAADLAGGPGQGGAEAGAVEPAQIGVPKGVSEAAVAQLVSGPGQEGAEAGAAEPAQIPTPKDVHEARKARARPGAGKAALKGAAEDAAGGRQARMGEIKARSLEELEKQLFPPSESPKDGES
ncbi:hypothetical protein CSA80_00145 [Candidatus Saccharibacteria bacterium]|nr:MAG: hypothetical protein CSA80_00145 [Candidatus Saccharibacteria bacterium]